MNLEPLDVLRAALQGVTPMVALNPLVLAAIMAGLKGLGGLFGSRRQNQQKQTSVAGLTLQQKMLEDKRRAFLALAQGLLGGVPKTTAGGGVNTNVDLDPALWDKLGQERTYDFGPTVQGGGGLNSFLEGLFGGAAETIPYVSSPNAAAAPTTTPQAGANPFHDPTFNLAEPTVTMRDLQLPPAEEYP